MGNILLLGGTGAIGSQAAIKLSHMGHSVYVTSRSSKISLPEGVSLLTGNALDDTFVKASISSITQGLDAIVDFMVYPTEHFQKRVRLLIDSTAHYIFLSSGRVYAQSDTPLVETSPRLLDIASDPQYLLTDEYALAKARQEDILCALNEHNWTIIRPYITFGDGRLQLGTLEAQIWLWRALHGLPVALPAVIMDKFTTMTSSYDVGSIIATLVGNEEAHGEVFNVATEEARTWTDIANIYRTVIPLDISPIPATRFTTFMHNNAQVFYDRALNRRFSTKKVSDLIGGWEYQGLHKTLSMTLSNTISNLDISPDLRGNAAMDALTKSHSGLGSGSISNQLHYFVRKHPRLQAITQTIRGGRD